MRSKIVSDAGIRKKKNRAYAVFIEIKARGHSACARERHHPTFIRAHQRAFSGGQRNIESALRVGSVDQQRAGNSHRHLCRSNGIFDIAAHLLSSD